MHKLVHLDFKGAPPELEFLSQLFPLLKSAGASGLLIEYEDTFPYYGDLSMIARKNPYTPDDIRDIQRIAEENGLFVVPLIQTIGHFEFVLKHTEFSEIREVEDYPMALCPLHPNSICVVTSMIDQLMSLHSNIKYLHIGADEVFHLGTCSRCIDYISKNGKKAIDIFLQHVVNVLTFIKRKYPHLECIMWDDMIRDISLDDLMNSGLVDLVEPMVWNYCSPIMFSSDIIDKYTNSFSAIWIATAYKGATGPCSVVTDIGYHIENHLAWLNFIEANKIDKMKGVALTGWQRYDHFAVLCELLCVSIPCLILCLEILNNKSFTESVHLKASSILKFKELFTINPLNCLGFIQECSFPGSKVYCKIHAFMFLKAQHYAFIESDRVKGWMSDFHIKNDICNPAHINFVLLQARDLLNQFSSAKIEIMDSLQEIYFDDCVTEWNDTYMEPCISSLEKIVFEADRLLSIKVSSKSYD